MLVDTFNRVHDYLRISITDACNFRCVYCMPEENITFLKQQYLMSNEEIFSLAKIFVDLGVTKIRLTGGEPLVRKDFGSIVSKLALLPIKIGITTNGLLLDNYLEDIKKADIVSINISLDSLRKEKFKTITQRDHFDQVMKNILLCIENNLYVKLNVVTLKGVNDSEIIDFVHLTKNLPIHVRFIEYMPFSGNNWDKDKVFSNQIALQTIENQFSLFKLVDEKNDTDKKFGIFGHAGTISFISTLTDTFCSTCNRLRITSDGKLKNCLFGKEEFDLITPLRNGENIVPIIVNAIVKKHEKLGGQFVDYTQVVASTLENRSMIKIGG
ncbi:MAG: GTP 3',8-cyclase MoaA [Candidatus Kapabacteria bacterium]|nr:GTP 3',8-cyclase MoaA [Candidatus Kapabacteria bacterium]